MLSRAATGGSRIMFRTVPVTKQLFALNVRNSTALRQAHTKTPVQQFGAEYLQKQMAMGRPLSPHLQIYKPQLTWILSGAHRIVGCIMGGTLFIGLVLYSYGPFSYTRFIERIRAWELPMPITALFKLTIATSVAFYMLNGVRMIGFEMAKGIDLVSIYRSGWAVLALTALIGVAAVANAKRLSNAEFEALKAN